MEFQHLLSREDDSAATIMPLSGFFDWVYSYLRTPPSVELTLEIVTREYNAEQAR
jgi:hypothetical protein